MNQPTPSDYALHLRWADLDTLNHVNNVRYVDYALEATGKLIDDGALPTDLTITRIAVDFLRPLMLSLKPVRISSVVSDGQIVQEIRAEDEVFAKVVTDFGSLTMRFAEPHNGPVYPGQLRRSDLDGAGHVTPAKVFELVQESRILHFARLLKHHAAGHFVVAKLTVDYHRPITWRTEPLPIYSWISEVRTSSMMVGSQISDGDELFATCGAVLVGFDMETQKSRMLSENEKEQLRAEI
ncbi:MAG: thioesterase family protein [Aeromicrobium sp.]